jgi:hypothetical protein
VVWVSSHRTDHPSTDPLQRPNRPNAGFIKRAVDVWRHAKAQGFASLVHRMDLEIARVLSQEKRESAVAAGKELAAASPPPPPPPPPRPRP